MQTATETTTARSADGAAPSGPAAARPARATRRPLVVVGALASLIVLTWGGYAFATRNEETTDDAQVEADVVPLAPRVGGLVVAVHVKDNQRVKRGDVLFELDPADSAARVKQAEAELATAQAQASAADAQAQVAEASARGGLASASAAFSGAGVAVSSAAANIDTARATLTRAEAEARRASIELERAQKLRAEQVISQQQLDNAQTAHDAAQAAVQAARSQLEAALEQKRAAESRVAEARGRLDQSRPIDSQIAAARANAALAHARVDAAGAALELARSQLSYTRVVAPEDGVVSRLAVHPGQLVGVGQMLASLVPQGTYVVANFKETQMGRIRPGQQVEVELDAYPGRTFEGKVESLAGGTGSRFSLLPPDNASGNFVKVVQRVPVRIVWTHPPEDAALLAGLSAEVTVHLQ